MRIAHISDIHCNYGTDFNEKMYEKAVKQLNKIDSDIIFISGDLTTDGLLYEYELAKEKLKEIKGKLVIVPGNHDERNLGWKLFPEFFGEEDFIVAYRPVRVPAAQVIGNASPEHGVAVSGRVQISIKQIIDFMVTAHHIGTLDVESALPRKKDAFVVGCPG